MESDEMLREPDFMDGVDHDEREPAGKAAKSARAVVRYEAPPSEVAPWQPSALALLSDQEFELRLAMAAKERDRIAQIQRAVMKDGVDYGVVPGTQKPTLLKPGAEILNRLAGLAPDFEVVREHGDGVTGPAIRYQIKCRLLRSDGHVVGTGDGAANSWERKYRYRNAERTCPSCNRNTIIKGRQEYGGGWVCFRKKGGCGEKYEDGDTRIVGQADQMENPDPHDLDNTLLKMAEKRAMVAATLIAHAGSGIFSQDLEDAPPPEPERPVRPAAARQEPARGTGNGGAQPLLNRGQKTLVEARAKKRAREIGIQEEDGWRTLLSDVLRGGGTASLDDVELRDLDALLEALDVCERG